MKNYQFTQKQAYSSKNKWELPMERVEYDPLNGQIEAQEKTINVSKNGTYTITPDSGKTLSKVTVIVDTGA